MKTAKKPEKPKIAEKLIEFRELAGLSRNDVQEQVGITTRNLGAYEHGTRKPTDKNLRKLADLYGCKVELFLNARAMDEMETEATPQSLIEQIEQLDLALNPRLVSGLVDDLEKSLARLEYAELYDFAVSYGLEMSGFAKDEDYRALMAENFSDAEDKAKEVAAAIVDATAFRFELNTLTDDDFIELAEDVFDLEVTSVFGGLKDRSDNIPFVRRFVREYRLSGRELPEFVA